MTTTDRPTTDDDDRVNETEKVKVTGLLLWLFKFSTSDFWDLISNALDKSDVTLVAEDEQIACDRSFC